MARPWAVSRLGERSAGELPEASGTRSGCEWIDDVIDRVKSEIMERTHANLRRWAQVAALLLTLIPVLVAGLVVEQGVVWAQSADAGAAAASEVTADQVNAVARELWCPLCSGVRLDACELKACEQMKEMIAIKLAEGEDVESIKAYFIEQYGPQVLGEPPRSGFNLLAWVLPVLGVVVGGFFFWRMTSRMVRSSSHPTAAPAPRNAATEDEYERKLEEELAKYG
jgi:cytochrome c-type biogenesis protein CcmH